MNKVILTGNLVREPELKQTTGGTSVVENTIAVNRDRKDANGEYQTDFIPFVAWGGQAEYLARNGRKGDRAEIVGRWQQREYTERDGNRRRVDEVQVENLSVFSRQQNAPSAPAPKATAPKASPAPSFDDLGDGDLPF